MDYIRPSEKDIELISLKYNEETKELEGYIYINEYT